MESWIVPTSLTKSFAPLWCPVPFLLSSAVLLDITSV